MEKSEREALRRAQIINAALECVCEEGTEGLTLEKAARRAGWSKGVVAYYFQSKAELVRESFRAFLDYYGLRIAKDVGPDDDAAAVLHRVVDRSLPDGFAPTIDTSSPINVFQLPELGELDIPPPKISRLFLQFFSRAVVDPGLATVLRETYRRDVAEIGTVVGALYPGSDETHARRKAFALMAFIDGLSLLRVTGVECPGPGTDRDLCAEVVNRYLGIGSSEGDRH